MRAFVLYVTITYLATYTANVYGIDLAAGIAEAIVTNAAVPGFFPPLIHANENYVDCGVVSHQPVQPAVLQRRGVTR